MRRARLTRLVALAAVAAAAVGSADADAAERALTLEDALSLARASAPSVKQAAARVADAEARLSRASAPRVPTVHVAGSGNGFASNGSFLTQGVSTPTSQTAVWADATLNLTWTLLDFGKTSGAVRGAEAGIDGAKDDLRASAETAMAQAAVAYYTLLGDEALVAAARESLAQRERSLAVTAGLASAGARSPVDWTRARAAVEAARSELVIAEATADDDALSLAAALSLPVDERLHVARPADLRVDEDPRAAADAALAARPELAFARRHVEQTRHDLDSAQRGRLPTLSTQASGTVRYTYLPDGDVKGGETSKIAQGSLILSMPILDPVITANVRAAEASVSAAEADVTARAASVRYEAARAAIAVRSARAVLAQSKQQESGAAATLAMIEDRYKNGFAGPLDLIDAQREDAAARVLAVRAGRALDIARLRLLAATGKIDTLRRR